MQYIINKFMLYIILLNYVLYIMYRILLHIVPEKA